MKLTTLLLTALFSSNCFAVELNTPAPDFTLKSAKGPNLRLEEHRGQVVLINFWATWCGPCRQEMPVLDKIQQRYEPLGFTVLGVNVEGETRKVRQLLERSGLSFPILFDGDQTTSETYSVEAMPFTVLVDRDGMVKYVHNGYKPGDEREYVNHLKTLLR